MKISQRLRLDNLPLARLRRHSSFFGLELALQAAQFASGILIVRSLAPDAYALYFLAFSVSAVITILADSGTTAGFNRIAGPLVRSPKEFADAFASLVALRGRIVLALIPVFAIVFTLAFARSEASLANLWVIGGVLLVNFGVSVTNALFVQPLRLAGEFNLIQRINLTCELLKAALIGVAWFFSPTVPVMILATTAPTLLSLWLATRVCAKRGFSGGTARSEWKREIGRSYLALLPNSAFYAGQGIISPAILSWFGSNSAVAGLGAISRFGRASSVLQSYFLNVVGPRLARENDHGVLNRLWFTGAIASIGLAGTLIVAFWVCAPLLLALLGPEYASLRPELTLFAAGMGLDLIIGYVVAANQGRGFFHWSARLTIPFSIVGLASGAALFDLATMTGVMLMGMCGRLPVLILQVADWIHGSRMSATRP